MDAIDKKILNNYLGLLEGLNPSLKLKLIDKLTKTIKTRSIKSKIKMSFGAWKSDETADELIDKIRSSRNTNRHIEEF